jgi:uncharacterized heparinase superfamily protein
LKPEWIFRLFETSNAEHVSFADTPESLEYTGRHHGYERVEPQVTHERTLRLSKADGALEIVDRLTGAGAHQLHWHFHLAPEVDARVVDSTAVELATAGRRWRLHVPDGARVSVGDARYSPSYGVALACRAIDVTLETVLAGAATWRFTIQP